VVSVCSVAVSAVVDAELSDEEEHDSDPPATNATTANKQANRVTAQA
jgi:hypothetical protein